MNLEKIISEYKPNIKQSSICSYVKTIQTMIDHFNDINFYNNFDNTNNYINNLSKLTTRKNKLSAIVVLLKANDADKILINKYSNELKKLSDEYNNFNKMQQKTKTQADNWIEYDDLNTIADDLLLKFNKIIKSKTITNQEYKILLFTIMIKTHLYIPLRNDLYSIIKISEQQYNQLENKTDGNYLIDGKKIIMNKYKTDKIYGQLIFKLPTKLINLYTKFFKFNTSNFLITSIKNHNMNITSNTYTKYFNSLFSLYYPLKKISSSLIRHIVASHDLKNRLTLKQKNEEEININKKFQHSGYTNQLYRKL